MIEESGLWFYTSCWRFSLLRDDVLVKNKKVNRVSYVDFWEKGLLEKGSVGLKILN